MVTMVTIKMALGHTTTMNIEIITTSIRDEKEFNNWITVTHPPHPPYDPYDSFFIIYYLFISS